MHHVLAIAGSLRRESLNRRLIAAAAGLATDVEVEAFDGLAEVPLYNADLEAADPPGPPAVKALRDRATASDGLLISTPEYNQALPAVTKNVVDWLSRAGGGTPPLRRKPVAIMGASDGPWGTRYAQKELRHTLTAAGALVLPGPMIFVARGDDVFDADGALIDTTLAGRIEKLLAEFRQWIETFAG
jgi:chromate reductase, NAD(P)H dehydrogenase (quinone)